MKDFRDFVKTTYAGLAEMEGLNESIDLSHKNKVGDAVFHFHNPNSPRGRIYHGKVIKSGKSHFMVDWGSMGIAKHSHATGKTSTGNFVATHHYVDIPNPAPNGPRSKIGTSEDVRRDYPHLQHIV